MSKPKIRISLFAYMMDRLERDNKLTFKVGNQEYEITLKDFRLELIWVQDPLGNKVSEITVKKPSEMN